MRITLTIDADVAASLERLRKERDVALMALVNEALRRGIKDMNARGKPRGPFRTRSVDLGRLKIGLLDKVPYAITIAEGESFK